LIHTHRNSPECWKNERKKNYMNLGVGAGA
jgi:hypothetical protein